MSRTDRDWEKWGAVAPYFGVLSIPKFQGDGMTADVEAEFFASGEAHIAAVFMAIERREASPFNPRRAVDVGCGVGRLVIPLAYRCAQVSAVDVSPSMLAEMKRNGEKRGLGNIEAVLADDKLSRVAGDADLVHSYLVLQHVPPIRGGKIIKEMARRVAPGGYLAFQVYVACNANSLLRMLTKLRYTLPPLNWIRNVLRSRSIFEQSMQLHVYSLPSILRELRRGGFSEVELHLDTEDAGNFESVFLLAKKSGEAPLIANPYA